MAKAKDTKKQTEDVVVKKAEKKEFVFAVGRRREAVARVRLYEHVRDDLTWGQTTIKKGDIIVNEKPIVEYFGGDVNRYKYTEPLRVANAQNKYTFSIKVAGGGSRGQLEAVVHGIATALSKLDTKTYHTILKQKGFLTRDARTRQRRNVGMGGKARRAKQSPKR